MPLRVRLSLVVAMAVAILVAAGGLLFVRQLQGGLDSALDTNLRARADALIQEAGPDETIGSQDPAATGLLPPKEALAQIVSGNGTLLDSSDGASGRPLLTPAQLTQARRAPLGITTDAEGNIRLLALPFPHSGQPPTVVVVGTTRELPEQAISRVRTALLIGAPVAVLLSALGAWLLAGAALRPVERMRRQAEAITAGDSRARLSVPATRDEVANLGTTLNALLARLHDALSRQRDFVADAGHELRTPLTFLRTELELATRPGRTRQDLLEAVNRAAGDTDRLIRLAEDLLLLAGADEPDGLLDRVPLRLDSLADEAGAAARQRASIAGVDLQLDLPTAVTVVADHDRIRQVVDNLLDNALRFAPPGSNVTLRVAMAGSPDCVVLDVTDQGPGFPVDFLPHAFERFRRADASRGDQQGGTGLGLAIVASLVRAHGGTVAAENLPGCGARVRVELPTAGSSRPM